MMKEYWQKLKEWWSNLAVREQRAVAIGGVVVSLLIAYQLIWSPLTTRSTSLRTQVATQQKLLVWMRATDKQLQQVSQSQSKMRLMNPVLLLAYLKNQIQQAGISPALKQLKQSSTDSVELHFQKVEFDKLISVLTKAVKEQSVMISQFSVLADPAPGMVDADIHLRENATQSGS